MARPAGHELNPTAAADALALASMTQREWAAAAGVAPSTVTGLVRGDHRASVQVATRLARATPLSRGTLFPSLKDVADASELTETAAV